MESDKWSKFKDNCESVVQDNVVDSSAQIKDNDH